MVENNGEIKHDANADVVLHKVVDYVESITPDSTTLDPNFDAVE